jgi:hypothetical protein
LCGSRALIVAGCNQLIAQRADVYSLSQFYCGATDTKTYRFSSTFSDLDQDGHPDLAIAGDLDLAVTNGWPFEIGQSHLYQNDNGVFTDISGAAGITDQQMGRGLLSLDYDNDGDLDIFITNNGQQPMLYRNDGGDANDWLRIHVEGTVSNRDGIGTFITLDPDTNVAGDEMVREIGAGSNFLSQNEFTAHFGLGPSADSIDLVTIAWSSGIVQELNNVAANQVLSLIESGMLGDFDQSASVDGADFLKWQRGESPHPRSASDLAVWEAGFYTVASPAITVSTTVPEPATVVLVLVVFGAGACLRWRQFT